jgi:uncharacterized iron-regulated membrane protein
MSSIARQLLRKVHLWLGLVVGLPFVLLSFSGSLLVFYIELDAKLNLSPDLSDALPLDWNSPVWEVALATVRDALPGALGQWSFEASGITQQIPVRYYAPADAAGHMIDPTMIWLSSDGTAMVRKEQWGEYLMTFLYDFHRHYLAGETGHQLVGWSGLGMLVLLCSGLVLWWPRGSWRKALAFKRNAASVRRVRDLHKLSGLWSLVLLLILVTTGALLALPAERSTFLSWLVTPVIEVPSPRSTVIDRPQLPLSQVLATVHRRMPDTRLAWIDVPGPGTGTFRIRLQVAGDPNYRFPYSFVYVDQYSGEILAIHDTRALSMSNTIINWLRPLHEGSVGGLPTRLLAVVLGVVPAVLFVTGILYWRRRTDARLTARSSPHLRSLDASRKHA